jgi:hypothetical protein
MVCINIKNAKTAEKLVQDTNKWHAECKRQYELFREDHEKCRSLVAPVFPALVKVHKLIFDEARTTNNQQFHSFCSDNLFLVMPRNFEEAFHDLSTTEEYRRAFKMDSVRIRYCYWLIYSLSYLL